jgi:hypothetical protein
MKTNRRNFLKSASVASAGAMFTNQSCKISSQKTDYTVLDKVLNQPILKTEYFHEPVIIESLELLNFDGNFLCMVRSTNGAEGISVANNAQMESLFPIFTKRLQPFFIGKDALKLEKLLDEVYVYDSNYKMQSLALWVPLATIEFAILDMLGRMTGKSIGELIGKIYNSRIAVYQANNYRGKSAEESIELIKKQVEETKAKALKFKIGGRMSNNADYPPGRTEKIILLEEQKN